MSVDVIIVNFMFKLLKRGYIFCICISIKLGYFG